MSLEEMQKGLSPRQSAKLIKDYKKGLDEQRLLMKYNISADILAQKLKNIDLKPDFDYETHYETGRATHGAPVEASKEETRGTAGAQTTKGGARDEKNIIFRVLPRLTYQEDARDVFRSKVLFLMGVNAGLDVKKYHNIFDKRSEKEMSELLSSWIDDEACKNSVALGDGTEIKSNIMLKYINYVKNLPRDRFNYPYLLISDAEIMDVDKYYNKYDKLDEFYGGEGDVYTIYKALTERLATDVDLGAFSPEELKIIHQKISGE